MSEKEKEQKWSLVFQRDDTCRETFHLATVGFKLKTSVHLRRFATREFSPEAKEARSLREVRAHLRAPGREFKLA